MMKRASILLLSFLLLGSSLTEIRYILQQKLIPILIMHPKDRVYAYITNANALFALSRTDRSPEKSVALAFRAEHSMTLLVGEVRRLNDTGNISSSLLFTASKNQQNLLTQMVHGSTGSIQNDFATILSFSKENEKTTKTIYYKAIPPGTVVPL